MAMHGSYLSHCQGGNGQDVDRVTDPVACTRRGGKEKEEVEREVGEVSGGRGSDPTFYFLSVYLYVFCPVFPSFTAPPLPTQPLHSYMISCDTEVLS